ncbi:MAG: trypsin-like peptidase domain-containing protein, partial [Melioribacteraceae bacterium]|nr:trypsin-like peptidase domain-containing protein [Melioribacteraceae bacterium]
MAKFTRDIIDRFRNVVIQIATPYSTGTGFYLKEYGLIVTNEHVVRDNKEVVIDGKGIDKQLVKVRYVDPNYDLSFLSPPEGGQLPEVKFEELENYQEGDSVIAIGHPFGLKYSATEGIISNIRHEQNNINYIQHDAALNPGNSGGPLLNRDGRIIGVNTFIIRDGNNIGFSLPVRYLRETLNEFLERRGVNAMRCNSCLNIVFEDKMEDGYCPFCGSKIKSISEIEAYEPFGVNKTIEEMLIGLGYNIDLSRRGPNNWQINKGSALINISYHEKSGLIVGDAYLCLLPKENIKPLYEYLLRQNYKLNNLTFSVKNQDIIISLLIYDQYLKA